MFTNIIDGQCVLIGRRAGWLQREIVALEVAYEKIGSNALKLDSANRILLLAKLENDLATIQKFLNKDTNDLTKRIARYVSFKKRPDDLDPSAYATIQKCCQLGTGVEDLHHKVEILKTRKKCIEALLESFKKISV